MASLINPFRATEAAHAATTTERVRVLVVDGDAATRHELAEVLESQYVVEAAGNGSEAVARLTAVQYDVVLLERFSAILSAHAVLNWIRAHRPALAECTIIMSAGDRSDLDDGEDKIFILAKKPLDGRELLRLIERCLASRGSQQIS